MDCRAVAVPYLQGQRLTLREYRAEDFGAFAAHLADPETAAVLGSSDDREAAWRIFGSHAGLWLLHGTGWWAVELREERQLVGTVGAFFRESLPGIEIGWNIYQPFSGQGFATEAATMVVRYALDVRKEPRVRALIAPGNTRSARVAEHVGMRYETSVEHRGKVMSVYARERESAC